MRSRTLGARTLGARTLGARATSRGHSGCQSDFARIVASFTVSRPSDMAPWAWPADVGWRSKPSLHIPHALIESVDHGPRHNLSMTVSIYAFRVNRGASLWP